ncbi:MAG: uracil-DNA glycosylase [candidate division Zixibacteria bacterium]|nr:uracil-DNA glycosylase [candidate division Zixibacteria bacterium]
MNGKPDNLSEMIRRALQVQSELGIGEIVVKHRSFEYDNAVADTASIVPVAQAVMSEELSADVFQSGLDVDPGPHYESLTAHCDAINGCMKCQLGEARNKFVYGVGNPNAGIMFVGEAPGADEDRLGEPFVGRAGQLLDKILAAMKLSRSDVYIANILKCRPPGNRDPLPEEMEKCFPYLREQVRIIKPKLICCLGRIAAQALLKTTASLGTLRGGWHSYEGVIVLVTYHPAALLRFPKYKKDTWDDMQKLLARYESMK